MKQVVLVGLVSLFVSPVLAQEGIVKSLDDGAPQAMLACLRMDVSITSPEFSECLFEVNPNSILDSGACHRARSNDLIDIEVADLKVEERSRYEIVKTFAKISRQLCNGLISIKNIEVSLGQPLSIEDLCAGRELENKGIEDSLEKMQTSMMADPSTRQATRATTALFEEVHQLGKELTTGLCGPTLN